LSTARRNRNRMMPGATLFVCTTCKAGLPVKEGALPPGTQLFGRLRRLPLPQGVTLTPVECLSACSQGCSVALAAPGSWGYVYGRLGPQDAEAILDGAARYAASTDGIVPWRERPEIFRKQSLARIPPLAVPTKTGNPSDLAAPTMAPPDPSKETT
jgi:predicted metal-binding protein